MGTTMTEEEFKAILDNLPVTFSAHCRSGLLPPGTCQCWRCKGERGEVVTQESRAEAARTAARVDAEFAARQHKGKRP